MKGASPAVDADDGSNPRGLCYDNTMAAAEPLSHERILAALAALNRELSVMDTIVGAYYPADQVPVKTRYLIESIFEEGLA